MATPELHHQPRRTCDRDVVLSTWRDRLGRTHGQDILNGRADPEVETTTPAGHPEHLPHAAGRAMRALQSRRQRVLVPWSCGPEQDEALGHLSPFARRAADPGTHRAWRPAASITHGRLWNGGS